MNTAAATAEALHGEELYLYGRVQGIGMRPAICRLARRMGLAGEVSNQRGAVRVRIAGADDLLQQFVEDLPDAVPEEARLDRIERRPVAVAIIDRTDFVIGEVDADQGGLRLDAVSVTTDLAACEHCVDEVLDPHNRRYRYAQNSCAACGPRFSMLRDMPYEREHASMAAFRMCRECRAEYEDAGDRRFHAQSIACHRCGPAMHLQRLDGHAFSIEALTSLDEVDAAATLIQQGEIVAIQGHGGFHLACDATNAAAVDRLRERKCRPRKPLAMMARDVAVIRRYAGVDEPALQVLESPAAPIALLPAQGKRLPDSIAPGMHELGFMLPGTPLQHLLFRRLTRPVVMTSGNRSGNPQCLSVDAVRCDLAEIADWVLWHDREIVNRVDDSVVRVVENLPRLLRAGRGHAPVSVRLPAGFANAPKVMALGGHLKNSLCLLQSERAVLSPHIGDLDSPATRDSQRHMLDSLKRLYGFAPQRFAVDAHPDYASTRLAGEIAGRQPVDRVQHHHAHAAACLAENSRDLDAGPVLSVVLDGIGTGEGGELWGGEFLLTDYAESSRLASLMPAPLPGGEAAMRQPWRNLYARLRQGPGWRRFCEDYAALPICRAMNVLPVDDIERVIIHQHNAPLATSAGRLFDAVACALGLPDPHLEKPLSYEGEAAMRLEALAHRAAGTVPGYDFTITTEGGLPRLDPAPIWQPVFDDLAAGRPASEIAMAFHQGFADGISLMVNRVFAETAVWREPVVALSGGVFQNALLHRLVMEQLRQSGFAVLTHARVPANDGGLALGQAVVSAARAMRGIR